MELKIVSIKTEFITLGALLKYLGIISQGSEASALLSKNKILVNSEIENRRGRKIYPDFVVNINDQTFLIIKELYGSK